MVPVFEQMGIDKEYLALGKRVRYSMFIKENQEKLLALDYSSAEELYVLSSFLLLLFASVWVLLIATIKFCA